MRQLYILLLMVFLVFSNKTTACNGLTVNLLSNTDLGNGQYLLTIEVCEYITNSPGMYSSGGPAGITGILLTVNGANIIGANPSTITGISQGTTVGWIQNTSNQIEYGDWGSSTAPLILGYGNSVECWTFYITVDSPAATVGVLCSSFVGSSPPGGGMTSTTGGIWGCGVTAIVPSIIVLPIILLSVDAINQGDRNLITWITNTEINNDFFTVERSVNGFDWEMVGIVAGAGNSIEPLMYSLYDENPYFPVSYYRLKQTDTDGEFTYSKILSVYAENKKETEIVSSLFPNPAQDFASFIFNGHVLNQPLDLKIMDYTGSIVSNYQYEALATRMSITLNISDLANGMYYVLFEQGHEISTQKLSIVR